MRIKKVFIKNFKGIKESKIIDFSDQTSLMVGPNGFGKTTVFDVLELCLTGRINRTLNKKNVTNDTKDYKKPFYQNTLGQDVIVKVWLEKVTEKKVENLIIVKFLSKDNDGKCDGKGRRNKPCDFELLSTYKELPENFNKAEFIPLEENKITNDDIDEFFNLNISKFKIENIYKLFNYLQQEDTTYFLKKSENDRKDTLGFLFQTSEQEKKLETINQSYLILNNIKEKLNKKISDIKKNELQCKNEYNKLFPDKNYEFDKIDIFKENDLNSCINNKESYFKELDKLSKFINRFSPDEYLKKTKVEDITTLTENNDFINFYVLQKLIEKNSYELLVNERSLINDRNKLESYILQNCAEKYQEFVDINMNYDDYKKFISIQEYDVQIKELKKFVEKIVPNTIEEYSSLVENRNNYLETSNEIEKSISEIIRLRNSIKTELGKNNIINDMKCPYCGNPWKTYEALLEGFVEREKELKKIYNSQSDRLENCDTKIKENFIEPIKKYMEEYIKKNNKIDIEVLKILEKIKDSKINYEDLEKNAKNIELVWFKPNTYMELKNTIEILTNNIKQSLQVEQQLFDRIKLLHSISFNKYIKIIESIYSNDELSGFIISSNSENKITMNDMEIKSKLLKEFLEKAKEKYKYDYDKSHDEEDMYKIYFDSQKEKFTELEDKSIQTKKDYIENELLLKQNSLVTIYEQRRDYLDKIINNIDKLNKAYDRTIKEYKKDMVNKIKIPFYLYTAKILQNYQQGMGVFLSTKENSDSIRFLTDSSSDHDAMHHLSSGQLAVVSLAFCLAINKTYNISQNLKFLVIDDPIQEMDALNIHAFVELIRHEFIQDYQLIFSTHNDSNALYIKYKFEKINKNSVKMINVQNEFFN